MNNELGIMGSIDKTRKSIQSFKDLNAWKEGHKLALLVYKSTEDFPKSELFGLTSQVRRSAVSVTSNIAEGFSRRSYLEKVQFYSMSQGSLTELQNQILLSKDVGFLEKEIFDNIFEKSVKVHKLLNGLIKKSKDVHNS